MSSDLNTMFGEMISTYSRAAGFRWPVALTSAVWSDCVEWTKAATHKKCPQDESGRLWDVLTMAKFAARTAQNDTCAVLFKVARVSREGVSIKPKWVTLKLAIGDGDDGEPVFTILHPDES